MTAQSNPARELARPISFARNIARYAGLLFDYFTQYAKVQLGYRGDFIVSLVTSFAATIFGLAFVLILFQKAPQLAGWSLPEEVFLYGFSLIPYGVFNILAANLYNFGNDYIIEGKFDRILLRPISSLFQILFETFRIEAVQGIATGLFCMWWGARRLHVGWTLEKLALLIFFGICASVIYLSIFLILTTVSFWFEDRVGIHPPVWNVIAFGRYPLSIYSGTVQFFLCWIIPFGLASFYPSVRLLGRAVVPEYAPFVPLVAVAFLALASSLWNLGTRHYSSTGS
ncbi:MAG TPA: ABC-2 family transporter protein [Candidatus Baltobacteraceae bacterium]|jgi:ABC-2 type transport system permease protein|nr:ABC-2 family transporter protein [Candidatus Baltobacteraceae bacterium]